MQCSGPQHPFQSAQGQGAPPIPPEPTHHSDSDPRHAHSHWDDGFPGSDSVLSAIRQQQQGPPELLFRRRLRRKTRKDRAVRAHRIHGHCQRRQRPHARAAADQRKHARNGSATHTAEEGASSTDGQVQGTGQGCAACHTSWGNSSASTSKRNRLHDYHIAHSNGGRNSSGGGSSSSSSSSDDDVDADVLTRGIDACDECQDEGDAMCLLSRLKARAEMLEHKQPDGMGVTAAVLTSLYPAPRSHETCKPAPQLSVPLGRPILSTQLQHLGQRQQDQEQAQEQEQGRHEEEQQQQGEGAEGEVGSGGGEVRGGGGEVGGGGGGRGGQEEQEQQQGQRQEQRQHQQQQEQEEQQEQRTPPRKQPPIQRRQDAEDYDTSLQETANSAVSSGGGFCRPVARRSTGQGTVASASTASSSDISSRKSSHAMASSSHSVGHSQCNAASADTGSRKDAGSGFCGTAINKANLRLVHPDSRLAVAPAASAKHLLSQQDGCEPWRDGDSESKACGHDDDGGDSKTHGRCNSSAVDINEPYSRAGRGAKENTATAAVAATCHAGGGNDGGDGDHQRGDSTDEHRGKNNTTRKERQCGIEPGSVPRSHVAKARAPDTPQTTRTATAASGLVHPVSDPRQFQNPLDLLAAAARQQDSTLDADDGDGDGAGSTSSAHHPHHLAGSHCSSDDSAMDPRQLLMSSSAEGSADTQQQKRRQERRRRARRRMKDLPETQQQRVRAMNRVAARRHRDAVRQRERAKQRRINEQFKLNVRLKEEAQTLASQLQELQRVLVQLHTSGRLQHGLALAAKVRKEREVEKGPGRRTGDGDASGRRGSDGRAESARRKERQPTSARSRGSLKKKETVPQHVEKTRPQLSQQPRTATLAHAPVTTTTTATTTTTEARLQQSAPRQQASGSSSPSAGLGSAKGDGGAVRGPAVPSAGPVGSISQKDGAGGGNALFDQPRRDMVFGNSGIREREHGGLQPSQQRNGRDHQRQAAMHPQPGQDHQYQYQQQPQPQPQQQPHMYVYAAAPLSFSPMAAPPALGHTPMQQLMVPQMAAYAMPPYMAAPSTYGPITTVPTLGTTHATPTTAPGLAQIPSMTASGGFAFPYAMLPQPAQPPSTGMATVTTTAALPPTSTTASNPVL